MKKSYFSEVELPVSSAYLNLSKVVSLGLLKNFGRVLQYYDEPKFWQYSATLNSKFLKQNGFDFNSVASGLSFFSQEIAVIKCLCESVERYCNHTFFDSSTSYIGTYEMVKHDALNPSNVVGFSKNQLKNTNFRKYRINSKSKFTWTGGISLITDKKVLIPSQLIYLSYRYLPNEPIIYPGISTGAAGGSNISGALVRGICEIVERDAFMIFYLNKIPARKVKLNKISDSRLNKLLVILKRYNMEVFTFDITTDIKIPTYLSIVLDRSGFGKAVALGLKCDLDQIKAIIGSIEETFNSRSWLRTEYEKNTKKITVSDLLRNSDIRTRGLLWYPVSAIKNLDFLLGSSTFVSKIKTKEINKTSGQNLKYILQLFKEQGYDVLYKDITHPVFKKLNYFVVKAIIPQMQPFYLDENNKLLGGQRLYEIPGKLGFTAKKNEDQLNNFPHPFL